MDIKPKLYIDVDGVLFGLYDGFFQLRPNVNGFMQWCLKHFECYWLTSVGHQTLIDLFNSSYGHGIAKNIQYINWRSVKNKAKAINLNEDFYWIEDGYPDAEKILKEAGAWERFIYVNHEGKDELYEVQKKLEKVLNERKKTK